MRKFWIAFAAALTLTGVPTAAFAAKPVHPVHPTTPTSSTIVTRPTVTYVLRGTLSGYTAATASNGSVSITVKSSNFERTTLKSLTLTFAVSTKTIVVHHKDKAITNGDRGIVKVRAPKDSTATSLQTMTAFQVIDQGASS